MGEAGPAPAHHGGWCAASRRAQVPSLALCLFAPWERPAPQPSAFSLGSVGATPGLTFLRGVEDRAWGSACWQLEWQSLPGHGGERGGGQGRTEAEIRGGSMWLPTEFPHPSPDSQHRMEGAEETLQGPECWPCTPPHSRAEPGPRPASWPHLGFREVPLASAFLASASSCSSSSPSADSTWEKRRAAVSRALVCGERGGSRCAPGPEKENKWGSDC